YAVPRLRENFAWWKLAATLALSFVFCAVPLAKTALMDHARFFSLLIGLVFVAATTTFLGLVSRNSKTFIVLFLSFWYIVVNSKGAAPLLDFAGFFGTATRQTLIVYGTVALVSAIAANGVHRARLART
ncbi:MAG: hypothetical protein ACJ8HU_11890, partial [Chthoniobacterales bacterium]